MELHLYIAFIIATSVMIALPGPSVLLTVAHSISFSWRHGIVTVAGATAGIAVQLAIAAIGLSSLLNSAVQVFEWLRWAGAIYLVYLGIKQWRNAAAPIELNRSQVSRANLFFQGTVVTIFNPKSLIFIAAFLPQFIDTGRPFGMQFALIVPTFLVITFCITSIWAIAAGNAIRLLKSGLPLKPVFRVAGGLMILAGAGLAMARRNS
jgi:homoserine/homoserine lactone efflux protein